MNNDLISRSEAEKLGAMCLARRNENGQLKAIINLDNAPTVIPEEFKPIIDSVISVQNVKTFAREYLTFVLIVGRI